MAIITAITNVFSAIGDWIATAVTDLIPMFYSAESGLTFLGTLSVVGLAMSVVFLLIDLVTFNSDVKMQTA